MPNNPSLILASTSRYRRELLQRLQITFDSLGPDLDESTVQHPEPSQLACQRAIAKAIAVSTHYKNCWILGSDQVCSFQGQALGKPGSAAMQTQQLTKFSGREARFDTAVALVRNGVCIEACDTPTRVCFRDLSANDIKKYVELEPALDCAGGFKVEGLGISLFEWVRSDDPTALIGLPLIATAKLLRKHAPELLYR